MKTKPGFIKRKIKDKFIVVAIGPASKTYKNFIELNYTVSLIWDYISIGKTVNQIAEEFVKEFKIDFDKALLDVQKTIDIFLAEGVICE